jgi:hypothetical protein
MDELFIFQPVSFHQKYFVRKRGMLVRVKKFEEQKVTFVDQDQERYIF